MPTDARPVPEWPGDVQPDTIGVGGWQIGNADTNTIFMHQENARIAHTEDMLDSALDRLRRAHELQDEMRHHLRHERQRSDSGEWTCLKHCLGCALLARIDAARVDDERGMG